MTRVSQVQGSATRSVIWSVSPQSGHSTVAALARGGVVGERPLPSQLSERLSWRRYPLSPITFCVLLGRLYCTAAFSNYVRCSSNCVGGKLLRQLRCRVIGPAPRVSRPEVLN